MKIIIKSIYILAWCTYSISAFSSGATSSGGGNTYNNSTNPWFLENTKEVSFCIDLDEQNMGINRQEALKVIRRSLEFWKNDFKNTKNDWHPKESIAPFNGRINLATQSFVEKKSCEDSTMLKFQLGTLTKKQSQQLKNIGDVIGIAYRTSYDSVNLRGKGFVYIAPRSGLLRPKSIHFSKKPWEVCDNCIFEGMIKHELGHVFGLGHYGYKESSVMGAEFPAGTTTHKFVSDISTQKQERNFFKYNISKPYLTLPKNLHFLTDLSYEQVEYLDPPPEDFFNLKGDQLIRVKTISTGSKYERVVVQSSRKDVRKWRTLGYFCRGGSSSRWTTGVNLSVDSQQKVFSKLANSDGRIDAYHVQEEYELSGSFCPTWSLKKIPLVLRKLRGQSFLGTVSNGAIDTRWLVGNTGP